jgi:hypothetical protein
MIASSSFSLSSSFSSLSLSSSSLSYNGSGSTTTVTAPRLPTMVTAPRQRWRLHNDGGGPTTTAAAPRRRRRLHDDGGGIPQFLRHPLSVLCCALTPPRLARFSAGFTLFPEHLILPAWPRWPWSSPASTRSPGSRKCLQTLLKILISVNLPAG